MADLPPSSPVPPPPPASIDAEALDAHSLPHLQALADDALALEREVARLAVAGGAEQLPTLAANVHRVAAPEQLEPLALALLAANGDAIGGAQLRLALVDELLRDVPPLTRLRVATQRLRLDTLEEPECALLLRSAERAMEQLLTADASDAAQAARLLLALHDATSGADFKVATLVWKHLTKLAAAFGGALADSSNGDAFQVDDVLASVIAVLEQCVLQLCDPRAQASEAALVTTLKFLRLYWRAFQGQLLSFLPALTSEVEASVMAIVNVAACLADVALLRRAPALPARVQAEASRLLLMVVALAEKLGAAADASASAREQVRVLLWHPDDDMVRAIQQRREEGGGGGSQRYAEADDEALLATTTTTTTTTTTSIRLGHLLAVAAFSSTDDNVLPAKDPSEERGGAKMLAAAAMLLGRFETCAWHEPVGALREASDLFLDVFLPLLLKVDDVAELQLFLLQQLVHPGVARQGIIWETWRELLCFGWDEARAAAVLTTLLSLAQCNDADATAGRWLTPDVQQALFEMLAFVFSGLPPPLKRLCVAEATTVIDALFSEGPAHAFTRQVASQMALLEHLVAASFLRTYNDDNDNDNDNDNAEAKDAWVAKYLPLCFECCGTVLDLLTANGAALAPAERGGMLRILDVCLLVAKAVLDDSDARGADVDELAAMLVPMSSEILTQLSFVDSGDGSRTLPRILETCTHVLGALGPTLKRNASNQFVLVLRDLARILERQEAGSAAVSVAWFASRTLFDVHVAPSDVAVVWQLFAQLFQRLSSGMAAAAASALHAPLVLDAFYRFLAHSNVPTTHPLPTSGAAVREMLHASAHGRFRAFFALKRLSLADADRALRAELRAPQRTHAFMRLEQQFVSRFLGAVEPIDSDQEPSALKRARHSADRDGDAGSKRRKLEALVAMCRRTHEMFGAGLSASLLHAVGEQEVDAATQLLEQLLASGALA
ncbi:hypothetical protein PybrP1_012465 [[Pythium] brassicae (nom. inval.)]|nr:hypothetical protein PybrP1_012465 [[Pythium] brassicae (nom. inval.)]